MLKCWCWDSKNPVGDIKKGKFEMVNLDNYLVFKWITNSENKITITV